MIDSLSLADRLEHRPSELSGGQQQRVAIARALITKPTVIFADEPTGALDSKTGQTLLSYLRKCANELGQTIVMVTHDPIAASYADRALILADGRIVGDQHRPTTDSVLTAMKHLDTMVAQLGDAEPINTQPSGPDPISTPTSDTSTSDTSASGAQHGDR